MAEPKKKLSKTRTNLRRNNYTVSGATITRCSNCREAIKPHIICQHCGFYGGKPIRQTTIKRIATEEQTK